MRKVVVYIAASVDGYIAGPNGDMRFLDAVQQEGEDYGYFAFLDTVDTVVMGRKTYDWVMGQVPEFPHADLDTYIITHRQEASRGKLHFHTDSLTELVRRLKSQAGKHIFVDGGAEIVNQLLKDGLVDELILSVIPVLLGDGVKLFHANQPRQEWNLVSTKTYEKGLVQLHYLRP
jgi:dihydrofolate reductase